MFRTSAPQRAQGPPSAYPNRLTPVGSSDVERRDLRHRISRTDLDFEQALQAEGTVRISEGVDVNALGKDASLSPSSHRAFLSPASTPTTATASSFQPPATPTVVPPTPSPQGPSSAAASSSKMPTRAVSPGRHDDPFTDTEPSPDKINRRSMYRSPGTSSSPDLATLLKKAREKGTELKQSHYKEKRRESPPPLPSSNPAGRPRSSTSAPSPAAPPTHRRTNKLQRPLPPSPNPSGDWVMPSPNGPQENGTVKVRRRAPIYRLAVMLTPLLSLLYLSNPRIQSGQKPARSSGRCWVRTAFATVR
jgi:PH and SEC7 domain-containing protein